MHHSKNSASFPQAPYAPLASGNEQKTNNAICRFRTSLCDSTQTRGCENLLADRRQKNMHSAREVDSSSIWKQKHDLQSTCRLFATSRLDWRTLASIHRSIMPISGDERSLWRPHPVGVCVAGTGDLLHPSHAAAVRGVDVEHPDPVGRRRHRCCQAQLRGDCSVRRVWQVVAHTSDGCPSWSHQG